PRNWLPAQQQGAAAHPAALGRSRAKTNPAALGEISAAQIIREGGGGSSVDRRLVVDSQAAKLRPQRAVALQPDLLALEAPRLLQLLSKAGAPVGVLHGDFRGLLSRRLGARSDGLQEQATDRDPDHGRQLENGVDLQ